jgi:hypothetical protein
MPFLTATALRALTITAGLCMIVKNGARIRNIA